MKLPMLSTPERCSSQPKRPARPEAGADNLGSHSAYATLGGATVSVS